MPQAARPMPQAWGASRPARANVAVSAALLQHVSRTAPPPLPMNTLLLKLIVTPVLIGAASLAGQRWGETLSGWFIGLPLTSGPVCWFLAIEQGTGFAAATARGLLLTEIAPLLGAQLSGMLATYPIFGAVLAAFAHHQSGAAAAGRVLRGLLIGLFGFTGFFLCLALAIEPLGIAASFAAATALALSIQGVSLWVGPVRRPRR